MNYRGLDSFRLFAFLAVFLFHVDLVAVGYLGVVAFFVLSGFLITPILVGMRHRLSAGRYFLNFYGRRSLRIFPLYYVYLTALSGAAILALVVNREPAALAQFRSQALYAFTYTYDFFHASSAYTFSPVLTHFWSLAVEEQFYLVWPFIVFLVPATRLKPVLLALLAAGPLLRFTAATLAAGPMSGLVTDRIDLVVYVLPFSHIDAFAMGGYLALYGRTPSRWMLAGYAAALLTVAMLTEWLATGTTGLSFGFGPFMADSWKHVWGYTSVSLLFGWTLLRIRDRGFMPRLMEHPVLAYLGKISYGLYVFHFAVIWVFSAVDVPQLPGPAVVWRAILPLAMLGTTVLISMVSYTMIEAPLLRLKDRYFPRGDPGLGSARSLRETTAGGDVLQPT